DALTPLVAWHGFVFSLWPALLLMQTTLVARRRLSLHRTLGIAGAVLSVLMIVIGMMAAIEAAQLGHRGASPVEMPDALMFLAIPVRDLFVFAVLAGLGFWYRHSPATHKRLMLLATLGGILPAPVGRLQALGPGMAIAGIVFAL